MASLRSYARPDGDPITGVDLHTNIDDAIRLLSHKLRDTEVTREYDEVPAIERQPGQLAQLWTNVLSNSAEAPASAITIRTSTPHEGWVPH